MSCRRNLSMWIAFLGLWSALSTHADDVLDRLKAGVAARSKVVVAREDLAAHWEADRLILQGAIDGFRSESERLKKAIVDERKAIGKADGQRGERAGQVDELKAELAGFEKRLSGWEARIRGLQPGLPPKLQRRLAEVESSGVEVSDALSRRLFRAILAVRTIGEFDRELTVDSELWDLPDGSKGAATIVYFGLAQAYFTDPAGSYSGIGAAVDGVWKWQPRDGVGARILELLKVHGRETDIDFVSLPAVIRKEEP